MVYRALADLTLLLHALFIAWAVLGGIAVLRRRRVLLLHLPAALWATLVVIQGWLCPLTPLENHWRILAGQSGYSGGFIEHYLLPLVYPPGLTRGVQVVLGALVLLVNAIIYGFVYRRWRTTGARRP